MKKVLINILSGLLWLLPLTANCQEYKDKARSGTILPYYILNYYPEDNTICTSWGALAIHKTDSIYEHGYADLVATGPVIIDPTHFSFGVGSPMNKDFYGSVKVDVSSSLLPAIGGRSPASVTGTYHIFYSSPYPTPVPPPGGTFIGSPWKCGGSVTRPCKAGHTSPGNHCMVEVIGTETENFEVYGNRLPYKVSGPDSVCIGDTVDYEVSCDSPSWKITPAGAASHIIARPTASSVRIVVLDSISVSVTGECLMHQCANSANNNRILGHESSDGQVRSLIFNTVISKNPEFCAGHPHFYR